MDEEREEKYKHKGRGGGDRASKNSRIKASLFKDKRKGKPKKTEDEGQEVKRLKNILLKNQVRRIQICLNIFSLA